MKITIIGNNAQNMAISDGGRIKIRLFADLLSKENCDVNIIELEGWNRHPFSLIRKIQKSIKNKERIIIMAGPKGCRKIIPLVSHFNKKGKAKIVFCPLGIGALDYVIKDMKPAEAQAFLSGELEIKKSDAKMGNMLSKFEYVVVQNKILFERYKSFYKLDNVVVLENFRNVEITDKEYSTNKKELSIIYSSRVKGYKGILDLMKAVQELNRDSEYSFQLDIYGENQLSDLENELFNKFLESESLNYCGIIDSKEMIRTLKQYDVFCLPTKYYGEGTSGSLIEAMLSGTPVLVSNYSQASEIITNNLTGFIYEFDCIQDLKNKLLYLAANKIVLKEIGKNAQKEAIKYTYLGNKNNFLKIMIGDNK